MSRNMGRGTDTEIYLPDGLSLKRDILLSSIQNWQDMEDSTGTF
jgi:hypothetical protein